MLHKTAFLTVAIIVTCFIVNCTSLECYKCTTNEDPKYCVDINSENKAEKVNCTDNDSVCIKIKREAKSNNVVYKKTVRDCVKRTTNTCGDYQQTLDSKYPSLVNETISYTSCTICSKNLCNSSTKLTSHILVTLFVLVFAKTL